MDHFCGHVIEGSWDQFAAFAIASEHSGALDNRMGLIRAVPMLAHVDAFRRANLPACALSTQAASLV